MHPTILNRVLAAAVVGALAMSSAVASAAVTAPKELPDGLQCTVDGGVLRVQVFANDTVRVTYNKGEQLPEIKSLAVIAKPEAAQLTRQENDQAFTLVLSK